MFFFFIFYLFSSTKAENRMVEQVLLGRREWYGTIGWGEVQEKGGKRVNTVQKIYKHVGKCKNDTC
jgi:hypothetical protein